MFKLVLVLVASFLLVEGGPSTGSDLAQAAKDGNWELFQSLLGQTYQRVQAAIAGSVESLQRPDDNSHVYGHATVTSRQWSNIDGKLSENSDGLEITNNDGVVSRRVFKP